MSLRASGPVRYVHEMRILLIAVTTGLLLAACGSLDTCACGAAPATPSTGTGLSFDVTVTETTRTASMRVGQKLEVVLHAGNGMNNWTQPKSSDESILVPIVDPAATAARGVTLAAFQAKGPGHADITAYGSPICPSGQPCPMYVMLFSVRVTVTP
jgi:hypothetical protein